jgi:hypothetical protein
MLGLGAINPINNGLLGSKTAGRTDRLPSMVAPGSHIIPADAVSGLGQGNSIAGAHILDNVFSHHLHSMFRHNLTPTSPIKTKGLNKGGKVKHMPVILAGGEYHVSPEIVKAIGQGDEDKGHKALDKMILNIRAHTIKTLATLPKPQK